jgi:hypothetical protein
MVQGWEYRVVHINLRGREGSQTPDPELASRRLGGSLSPEFIAREFPDQYTQGSGAAPPKHPAEQLQHFLNLLGREGWEMVEAPRVGDLLMFVFKRPAAAAGAGADSGGGGAATNAEEDSRAEDT